MIKGKIIESQNITEEFILSKISYYDIFHFYVPNLKINQSFSSPFRKDKSPSATIKISKTTGVPYYYDFSTEETMNVWQYLKKLFGKDYNEVMHMVASDMGIIKNDQHRDYKKIISKYEQPSIEKGYQRFDVWTRKYTKEEADYWNLRYLDISDLKLGNIFAYEKFSIDGKTMFKTNGLLSFALYYPSIDSWKIYTPHADKSKGQYKWLTNVPIDHIEGLNQLKKDKLCIGTKSRKDTLITSKFIPEVFECQNESIASINDENLKYIQNNSKECYLWFDNDATGVKSCTHYNQFGLKYVNIPTTLGVKDQDEFIVKYQPEAFKQFLKEKRLIQ